METTNLSVIALFKELDTDDSYMSTRTTDAEPIVQPFITRFYVGYYDGGLRFHDGEASGIEVHSLPELKADIAAHPEKYTEDLKYMVQKYEKDLVPISKI